MCITLFVSHSINILIVYKIVGNNFPRKTMLKIIYHIPTAETTTHHIESVLSIRCGALKSLLFKKGIPILLEGATNLLICYHDPSDVHRFVLVAPLASRDHLHIQA